MSNLYELTEEYLQVLDMAEDPDIDQEVLQDTLDAIGGEIELKADGYAKVMRSIDGDIAALKAEIDRMTVRKKSMENSKERIKNTLEAAMKSTGMTKFKTELFSFGIQKNPASVRFADDFDIKNLPEDCITVKDPEPNKAAIKDALKDGKEIPGCYLERTEGLRIR